MRITDGMIENYLRTKRPEHLNGWKEGWLRVEKFRTDEGWNVAHVYSDPKDGDEYPVATLIRT